MYHLYNTDLGFAFKNRGAILSDDNSINDQVRQIPEITETCIGSTPLLPVQRSGRQSIDTWDNKPYDAREIDMEGISISEEYAAFYEFTLLKGEMLSDAGDRKHVLINESAAKAFGWHEPVGKSFGDYTVKGVIKDVYNFSPTVPPKPFYYTSLNKEKNGGVILFKYREGMWQSCRDKIERLLTEIYPGVSRYMLSKVIYSDEEEYGKLLKSENTLLKILTFISLICMIISVFGFVSIISLTCEERRKEIAIRKVNGATVKDILDIFFKEYMILLATGT
jgi:ABC-type antimicrobial peptide transport system permease subunit